MKYNPISIAVKTALGLSIAVGLPMGSVYAEEGEDAIVEEVMVTGSRIQRSPIDTVGPITVLDGSTIEASGAISVEEVLRQMPSISLNGTNANDANGGGGAHFSGIHNLDGKTLVLVNGKRFTPSIVGGILGVDLNNIPTKMVDRIEVLADGASAVYGSDAVAGVINIILKKDMQEGLFEIGGGVTHDGGRETLELSLAKGGNIGDKGSFVAGLSYADRKGIDFTQRDWAEVPILAEFGGSPLIGSGIPPTGTFSANDTTYTFVENNDTGESFSDFNSDPDFRFNYNTGEGDKPGDLISPVSNLNTYLSANYDINSTTTAYAEVGLSKRDGTYQMMGLPISGSHGKYTDMTPIPLDNPNLPADALALLQSDADILAAGEFLYSWRSQDLGQRFFEFEGETINLLTGLKGDFAETWSYDAYIGYGQSKLDETTKNQVNVTNLRTAVDPTLCAADPACNNAFSSTGGAIDIFGRNTYTQAQKDYVLFTDTENNEYSLTQIGASVSSDLMMLPAGMLSFAGGVEYREEEGSSSKSAVTVNGDSGGNFAEPTDGGYEVADVFAEVNVPLLFGKPLAEELTLDAAARYSDYSTFGGEATYRMGLSWAPVYGLRFRAVNSTAYRAPDVIELFGGKSDSYLTVGDPCKDYTSSSNATLVQNCQDDGVPASYDQSAAQMRVSIGGNESLEPETATTTTFGIVFTAIENLAVTLDYYNVDIDDALGTPNSQSVIDDCYLTPGLNNTSCSRIDRNANGDVTRFDLLTENLSSVKSEGIDLTLSHNLMLGSGELYTSLLGAYLIEYSETNADGVKEDFTGKVYCAGCGYSMYPEFRANLTVGYKANSWDLALTTRYLPEMEVEPFLASLGDDNVGTKSDAFYYVDVAGSYNFGQFKVIAGIDNIANDDPAFIPDVSNNTSDGYDWLGRYYYTKVQFKF